MKVTGSVKNKSTNRADYFDKPTLLIPPPSAFILLFVDSVYGILLSKSLEESEEGEQRVSDFYPIYIYMGLVAIITMAVLGASLLFPAQRTDKVKYMAYESGIQRETHLLQKRVPLHHYLTALVFLVFDIEVIFLYPWAAIGKQIGAFAFYEMAFFLIVLLVGFAYIWRKKGLEWE